MCKIQVYVVGAMDAAPSCSLQIHGDESKTIHVLSLLELVTWWVMSIRYLMVFRLGIDRIRM